MSRHRYRIGQKVRFAPGKIGKMTATGDYSVTRQLPIESGENMYRVKSSEENFERVARESQISASSMM